MSFHRREVLGALGVGAASTLLSAFACGGQVATTRRAPQVSGEVRTWLHDAVERLATRFPSVHALAVSRHRTTAALDVLGPGLSRLRGDGVVLTVRDASGRWREHVTSELSEAGVDAAVQALGASRQRKPLDLGRPPPTPDEPPRLDERDLRNRLELLLQSDATLSSRIVYSAGLLDIDDATTWSVAPGRDLEQRLVRIRHAAIRAASSGSRPVVCQIERAWSGWLDDHPLQPDDVAAAGEAALELMTPGSLDDGERTVVLEPSVAAALLDAAVRSLLTTDAVRRPEAARRATLDTRFASPLVTLIDDPTTAGAYGRFQFDDEGEPASPLTLVDAGRLAARLADHAGGGAGRGRRPGHLARVEPSSSHLQLVPGTASPATLRGDGLALEGGLAATVDPQLDRVRVTCARARELRSGSATGRVYADVELVGSLAALLTSIDAVASAPTTFALRDDPDRDPTWRSISTPAIRTRGTVRARRSRA
ncbi:MAG TPA: metallopeptidase TldD-related protein [Kofleriaceae bacterium]|nr:metallopeptidase TldD-related protein [Kofleriaceae bacterium]